VSKLFSRIRAHNTALHPTTPWFLQHLPCHLYLSGASVCPFHRDCHCTSEPVTCWYADLVILGTTEGARLSWQANSCD